MHAHASALQQQPGHGSVITGSVPDQRHKQPPCAPPPRRLDASPLRTAARSAHRGSLRSTAVRLVPDHNPRVQVRPIPLNSNDSHILQHRLRVRCLSAGCSGVHRYIPGRLEQRFHMLGGRRVWLLSAFKYGLPEIKLFCIAHSRKRKTGLFYQKCNAAAAIYGEAVEMMRENCCVGSTETGHRLGHILPQLFELRLP